MLAGLSVANFAVAKNITLDLNPGLSVITGETGAGKSILVGALLVGLGGRWQSEYMRHGAEKATIELVFQLDKNNLGLLPDPSIVEDGELIVSRIVDQDGKSRIRTGGIQSTLTALKDSVSRLVDVHSQFEAQSLLYPSVHLELLDKYAGGDHLRMIEEFSKLCAQFDVLFSELTEILTKEAERAKRIDYINFELEEFKKASPEVHEDEELALEKNRLTNVARLADLAQGAKLAFDGLEETPGIRQLARQALKSISELVKIDPALSETKKRIEEIEAGASEAANSISEYIGGLTFDPERLQCVEDRLAQLGKIIRRFGTSLSDVFEGVKKLQAELEGLSKSETRAGELRDDIEKIRKELGRVGKNISAAREGAAEKLCIEVMSELSDLALDKATFKVGQVFLPPRGERFCFVDGAQVGFAPNGCETAEFLISTNPGEPPKSIQKVASGGELSRIMLALKVILSKVDNTPTLVFDEVDAGVGGRVGEMIARKLARIAKERQVICISHLPQIASFGDTHLVITKREDGGETIVECFELAKRGRIDELARMLSGDKITPLSQKHAEEMLQAATKIKETL